MPQLVPCSNLLCVGGWRHRRGALVLLSSAVALRAPRVADGRLWGRGAFDAGRAGAPARNAPAHSSRGPPLIVDAYVQIAGRDGVVRLLDSSTGSERCNIKTPVGSDRAGPALIGGLAALQKAGMALRDLYGRLFYLALR